jgi:hypothetical protein
MSNKQRYQTPKSRLTPQPGDGLNPFLMILLWILGIGLDVFIVASVTN